jgi:hypothetical protein
MLMRLRLHDQRYELRKYNDVKRIIRSYEGLQRCASKSQVYLWLYGYYLFLLRRKFNLQKLIDLKILRIKSRKEHSFHWTNCK